MLDSMAKKRVPTALSEYLSAIGRKGGKAKGKKKGFAAMSEEKRREIQEQGWAARRKAESDSAI